MISFLKKYKAIPYGFTVLYIIVQGLVYVDFIRIDSKEILFNLIGFVFWGLVVSMIMHALLFHRKKKVFYVMILGWVGALLGFILGRLLDYKVLGVSCIFLFFIISSYILWSWYVQQYQNKKGLNFLKERKLILIKLASLSVVFIIMFFIDDYMGVPDNPITFVLLTLFWLGVFYVLVPKFFQKYRFLILGLYGILFAFFILFITLIRSRTHEENLDVFILFLFPLPLFIILWIYDQWKWFKNLKADKAKAELALLKQQVNPHFFFNTLNNLYGLAKQKSDQTPDLILKLSEIMRYVIYKGKENEVKIEEEIEYLENYIELQKIRHHEKVAITFTKNIQCENVTITPLLFIILLENAFKHGVDSMIYNAFVDVNLTVLNHQIRFEVSNSFDLSEDSNGSKGIGLENLKKRLEIIYAKDYVFNIVTEGNIYKASLLLNI
ncbi:sensor histidine kinase [Aquimarina aggregata]|uniref:sensor histidine kinase n=1 Tax=Aquimarina aggregata TaxID=1642818 RepID=UPI0024911E58|nr:histidine kinase [Aquimarina aggregata]